MHISSTAPQICNTPQKLKISSTGKAFDMSDISKAFEKYDIFTILSCISTLAKPELTPGYLKRGCSERDRKIGAKSQARASAQLGPGKRGTVLDFKVSGVLRPISLQDIIVKPKNPASLFAAIRSSRLLSLPIFLTPHHRSKFQAPSLATAQSNHDLQPDPSGPLRSLIR
jgi:hypothetical protein